jgi:hypothetical protein
MYSEMVIFGLDGLLLGMDDFLALGTLRPERGLSVLAFVLDEYVVGGNFSPAIRALSECRGVMSCRGHG